ncbi:hypothetical protein FB566_2527 [Stackebrandtia endophytica]|uniref:Uncharacterized protein n=1 Tax=Stackebrandtia endophytica TaxID=1496996 RepID=A0A543AWM7_9ACTN|nr:hypothetical protein [Stackebrandtia endophytica]TQL76983.1 hypothetical protein FB566_2527 [Stackebrandtia endophytica]
MKTGEELAADLRQLMIVATVKIPNIANIYAKSATSVYETNSLESSGLGKPGPGGAVHGTELKGLIDLLYKALWANSSNLIAVGEALETIAWNYATEDEHNAADILKTDMDEYESWGDTVDQAPEGGVNLPSEPADL